jgi:uncharacterized protein YPO0396
MTKKELIELGLSEEDAKKVEEASTNELKSFIPKNRFDEVNASKKQLETDIAERDKQLETLKNSNEDSETLKTQIAQLQDENKVSKEKYDADIKNIKIANALEKALTGAKAKNIKVVKPLLDLENVELLEDGSIKDLDKQIQTLKESEESSFLFNTEDSIPSLRGVKPSEGNPNPTPKDPSQMNYAELCEFMEAGNQI